MCNACRVSRAGKAELSFGWINAMDLQRPATLHQQLGERAVATADVDPALTRTRCQPVNKNIASSSRVDTQRLVVTAALYAGRDFDLLASVERPVEESFWPRPMVSRLPGGQFGSAVRARLGLHEPRDGEGDACQLRLGPASTLRTAGRICHNLQIKRAGRDLSSDYIGDDILPAEEIYGVTFNCLMTASTRCSVESSLG